MNPEITILETVIIPALKLLPPKMDSAAARVAELTFCGQEADFKHRWQVVDLKKPDVWGPALGLWQFERGGGVKGVLSHPASREEARAACKVRNLNPDDLVTVHRALVTSDTLAAIFARLLMWTDVRALPPVGDEEGAFQLYLRTWRPGAHERGDAATRASLRRKFGSYYERAMVAVGV